MISADKYAMTLFELDFSPFVNFVINGFLSTVEYGNFLAS